MYFHLTLTTERFLPFDIRYFSNKLQVTKQVGGLPKSAQLGLSSCSFPRTCRPSALNQLTKLPNTKCAVLKVLVVIKRASILIMTTDNGDPDITGIAKLSNLAMALIALFITLLKLDVLFLNLLQQNLCSYRMMVPSLQRTRLFNESKRDFSSSHLWSS